MIGMPVHRPTVRWRDRLWFWPVIVTISYLVVASATVTLEYTSEMSKISRGMFTDTFAPYVFSELLTLPISKLHPAWHGYPDGFDPAVYRQLVRNAVWPTLINIVLQVVLIAAVVAVSRRRQTGTRDVPTS
jgi:hypothetical protein